MEINEYRDSTNKKGGYSPKYSSDGEGGKIEKKLKNAAETVTVTDKISHRVVGAQDVAVSPNKQMSFSRTGDDKEPDRCPDSVLNTRDGPDQKVRLIAAQEIIQNQI